MVVYECTLRDRAISLNAKLVHSYMRTFPDGWKFYADNMAERLGTSRYAIDKALKQLIEHEYIHREPARGQDGIFMGYVYGLLPVRKKLFLKLKREMEAAE